MPDNWFTELWQIQKVLANDRINIVEICMLAMFLNIPVDDLCNMTLPQKSQQQIFDEEIDRLHEQGVDYAEIADRLNASIHTVKCIAQCRYGTYHKQKSQPLKSGAKVRDWQKIDRHNLPLVQSAIQSLQGDGTVKLSERVFDLDNDTLKSRKQLNHPLPVMPIAQQIYL